MARNRTRYSPRIGTVSHGTMRTVDLLDIFAAELAPHKLSAAHRKLVREAQSLVSKGEDHEAFSDGTADDVLSELFDAMDAYAPPYVNFGAHEADGADYGYWPSWGAIEEDRRSGDLPNADDVPKNYTGLAVEVNDHGNVTLYRCTRGKRSIVRDCV